MRPRRWWRLWRAARMRSARIDAQRPTVRTPDRPPDGYAIYVGTTTRSGMQHRLADGQLFGGGRCAYWIVGATLVLQRESGPVLALRNIDEVGVAGAHAGKIMAPRRIAIITWRARAAGSDERPSAVVTGERASSAVSRQRVRAAVSAETDGDEQLDTGLGFDDTAQAEAFADAVAASAGVPADRGPHAGA